MRGRYPAILAAIGSIGLALAIVVRLASANVPGEALWLVAAIAMTVLAGLAFVLAYRDIAVGEQRLTARARELSREVAARERSEEAGRHSAERFRAVIDNAHDAIIAIDAQGRIEMFNKAAVRIFGYTPEEVFARNVNMLMPSPYKEAHDHYIHSYLTTGVAKIIGMGREVEGRRKDGSVFPMDLSVGEMRVGDSRGFIGVVRDLTERKLVETSRDRLAAIVESSHDAVIGKDLNGFITSWNHGAEEMYGYTPAEAVGKPLDILAPPDRKGEVFALIERIKRGEVISNYDTVRVTKSGRPVDVSLTLSPIYDAKGNLIGVSTIARNVTELHHAERRIRELTAEMVHISRLSAMGQLSSSLAHELNQPLSAVMNYAEAVRHMLSAAPGTPPRVLELLEKTAGQAERAGQIIRRLRSFVEKGTVERSEARLSEVVEEASALATVGARVDGIRVIFDLDPNLPPVNIDKIQVQQVVVNLVRNAVEVLRQAQRRELTIRTLAGANGDQEVAVIDSGPGISPEIAEQLFKPFVTTKKDGMGIGLSISQSIVEAHGGRIWVEPNPTGGAVFRFSLPVSEAA